MPFKNKDKPEWFVQWQNKFYSSKVWKDKVEEIKRRDGLVSAYSHKGIKTRVIVDHIIEITPQNYQNMDIILGNDNLQLLSEEEHNYKHYDIKAIKEDEYEDPY